MRPQPVPATGALKLSDHRRHPGSRVYLTCALCGWTKGYSAERVIARLRSLRSGHHDTLVGVVARRGIWPCTGCGRVKSRSDLAWPPGMYEREIKRLANRYRN